MARTKLTPSQIANSNARSFVQTAETTTSNTYAALTTAQSVAVTVGVSGNVLVFIGASIGNTTSGAYSHVAWQASGANTIAAADNNAIYWRSQSALSSGSTEISTGKTFMLTGLTPGSTTFTLLFNCTVGTAAFERREIWALAI